MKVVIVDAMHFWTAFSRQKENFLFEFCDLEVLILKNIDQLLLFLHKVWESIKTWCDFICGIDAII